jgi:steroid delta-isomerase-like uncharacterized protein
MPDNKRIVREFIRRVLNEADYEAANRFVHDDVLEQEPFPGQGRGLAGVIDVIRMLRQAFPDWVWKVEEQIAEGDAVVTRFSWGGTHMGEFFGVPATQRRVDVWGVVIDRFVDSRIKYTRIIMDVAGLMAQLQSAPTTVR